MARAAFVMDRLLRTIGLPGKAFIPMLVGFGCNVPAIMATRTLENERDRVLTILINPFMSCGARLPVYALFAVVFFPRHGTLLIFALYVVGIVLAILSGLLFKRTILQGEPTTFVMELPPYHVPTFRGIMHHTWNRLKGFILRAGKVILIVVAVLSILGTVSPEGKIVQTGSGHSLLGRAGRMVTPVFGPMGITDENWPACVGLVSGVFAKEAVVGALDALYTNLAQTEAVPPSGGMDDGFDFWGSIREACMSIPRGLATLSAEAVNVREALSEQDEGNAGFVTMHRFFDGPAAAIAYVLFVLVYAPCVAALAAIYRETNLKWMLFALGYLTWLAWVVATLFYQTATFFDNPGRSLTWLAVCASMVAIVIAGLRLAAARQTPAASARY
jgi:ferrous iron transport protein B